MEVSELKAKLFTLLREDVEFRYAVAGLLGLEEILRRLDRHEAELVRLREDFNKMREDFNRKAEEDSKRFTAIEAEIARLREDMVAGFKRHDEEFAKIWSEIAKLREDMIVGFKRHDELFEKHWQEIARLREDMIAGFKRHDEEIRRLREDMIAGFKRHDEEFVKIWSEIAKLREDMVSGFKRHDEEIARLRADMMEGFNLLKRHLDALGARWGLLSEQAFREGLRSLIEKEFGFKVEKWVRWDSEGYVHGHPSDVDVDIAVHDEKIILIEIKSHVGRSDVSTFKRKAEFYERVEGRKPDRLLIVTPYADEKALETAKQLQIEVYTGV